MPAHRALDDATVGVFTDALEHAAEHMATGGVPYGFHPDYVGRGPCLDELLAIVARTRRASELSFVLLTGQAGMGKSRTVKELGRALKQRHPDTRLLTATGDGSNVPYGVFARLLARRFGLSPGLGIDACQQRILRGVSDVLPSSRVTEVAHLVAHLMRIPLPDSPILGPLAASPQQLETRMFIAVRRFLAADAAAAPLVLVIEDLEQCSAESIHLMHYLAQGLRSSPVVLLATARPELLAERHPSAGDTDVPLRRVALGPLGPDDAVAILRDLFRALGPAPDPIPAELEDHARAMGGSPRALIELMRFLLESRVIARSPTAWAVDRERLAATRLPARVEELVGMRLDVMDPAERALLSMAAIIGEVFWLDAVLALVRARALDERHADGPLLREIAAAGERSRQAVSGTLAELVEREWIAPVDESSLPGEREYRFASPHLRRMVLQRTDAAERCRHHRTAAQWRELRPDGRTPTAQEQIARHFEQAGLVAEAAIRYRRAADQARASYDNQRATRLYTAALRALGDRDLLERIEIWHDLGSVYELKGALDAALDAFERMLRLAWVTAARSWVAVAFNKMGRVWRRRGDLKLALAYLERGARLFEIIGDARGVAGSLDDVGSVLTLLGRYDEAFEKVTAGLERRREGDARSVAISLANLGNVQRARGLLAEARSCHQKALELRRGADDRSGVISSLSDIAVLDHEHGDVALARSGWVQALTEAQAIGALPLCALALCHLGALALAEGHHDEAHHHLGEALALAQDIEDWRLQVEAMRNLALIERALGQHERARELAGRACEIAAAAGWRDGEARALLCLGRVLAAGEDAQGDAGQRCYDRGLALLRDLGNEPELARGLEQVGRDKIERGERTAGSQLLREALAIYAKLGMKRGHDVERRLASLP